MIIIQLNIIIVNLYKVQLDKIWQFFKFFKLIFLIYSENNFYEIL